MSIKFSQNCNAHIWMATLLDNCKIFKLQCFDLIPQYLYLIGNNAHCVTNSLGQHFSTQKVKLILFNLFTMFITFPPNSGKWKVGK